MSPRSYFGEFEVMVMLALIRLGEDVYGVPIAREIETYTRREVKLGSVYAALQRLEQKGLVASILGDPTPQRGGRAKRFFQVTPKGLREVHRLRRDLIALWRGVPE